MPAEDDFQTLLIIRPWLGSIGGGEAYAHFDALAMRLTRGAAGRRYGDFRMSESYDHGKRPVRLDNFRIQCQIDERHGESYGWLWGFHPQRRDIFTMSDFHAYGTSIRHIEQQLDKIRRADGPADSDGRLIVRLARILRLDGIALLETSQTSYLSDDLAVRNTVAPDAYGDAIRMIDDLVVELHRACAQRMGKIAA
jgi:hypothetical protein